MPIRFITFALFALLMLSCSGAKAPPIGHDYALTKITDRVYVVHGPNENPNSDNQGFYNNPGFVRVRGGVVVIDPGASVQVGEMLLRKIADVTRDPVIAVFDTHVHGDHWLGNQAIKEAYPGAVIYAHLKTMQGIEAGAGDAWLKRLNDATHGAGRGTRVVAPDLDLENGDALRLHGTTFRILHNGRAHTDSDIMIEVPEEGVIFLGDVVLNHRIAVNFPEQGSVRGQIAAIDMALGSGATHFIPGHGMSGGRQIALVQKKFLEDLHAAVKKYYDQGMNDSEMKDKIMNDLSAYRDYFGFAGLGRVISAVHRQVEIESF